MWEIFKDWIFNSIQFFANIVGDWGLAIVIVTLIFRAILAPIMHTQIKSSYKMQKVQPLMTEIQEKFANDPTRMQEEMQKLYAESKFNPLAGCLPMLLQMPIFIAMFQSLREMGERDIDGTLSFYGLVKDLSMSPSVAFSQGFFAFLPYLILMLVFAFATFLPMILQTLKGDSKQRSTMLMTGVIMSVMMLWISWSTPAGVLLFWGTSSIVGIVQQQLTNSLLRKADAKAEAEAPIKPVSVSVERKVKKKRPTKKR